MSSNEIPRTSELIASALQLPITDRVAMVNAMLESLEDGTNPVAQSEIDASWSDEIAQRVNEIDHGRVDTVPSTEVWKRIDGKPNA